MKKGWGGASFEEIGKGRAINGGVGILVERKAALGRARKGMSNSRKGQKAYISGVLYTRG
jgi:hypothetical protein